MYEPCEFKIYKERTCCFTGHRSLPKEKLPEIAKKLGAYALRMIEIGCNSFICGGALGFDTMAAATIINLREIYPDIRLVIAVPHKGQSDRWSFQDRVLYRDICSRADKVIVLADEYSSGCMAKRNRFMVDSSSYCIAYSERDAGGSYSTLKYAQNRGLQTYNIAREL